MPDFLYVLTKGVTYWELGESQVPMSTPIKHDIRNPSGPVGDSVSGTLTKAKYKIYAKNIVNWIESNNQAPNYVSTSLGRIQYQSAIYYFSKIIAVSSERVLPNSASISISSSNAINKYLPYYVFSPSTGFV